MRGAHGPAASVADLDVHGVVEDSPGAGYDARVITPRPNDATLCPEGDFRFWGAVGAGALLVSVAGCLGGLRSLVPGAEPSLLARLSAAGATVVWVMLCSGAGSLAFASLALVRGRPAGAPLDIASRAFACVAVASLVDLVPVGIGHPFAKAAFDGLAFAVSSAMLARSAYRIAPLDAFAAVAVGAGIVGALAAVAFVVTWAVHP